METVLQIYEFWLVNLCVTSIGYVFFSFNIFDQVNKISLGACSKYSHEYTSPKRRSKQGHYCWVLKLT